MCIGRPRGPAVVDGPAPGEHRVHRLDLLGGIVVAAATTAWPTVGPRRPPPPGRCRSCRPGTPRPPGDRARAPPAVRPSRASRVLSTGGDMTTGSPVPPPPRPGDFGTARPGGGLCRLSSPAGRVGPPGTRSPARAVTSASERRVSLRWVQVVAPVISRRTQPRSSATGMPINRVALATAPGHSIHGSTRAWAAMSVTVPAAPSTAPVTEYSWTTDSARS